MGLLALSGELRNSIWRFALVEDKPIDITSKVTPTEPALLAVNRQIRKECTGIYYGENAFQCAANPTFNYHSAHQPGLDTNWLRAVGTIRAKKISRYNVYRPATGLWNSDAKYLSGGYEYYCEQYRRLGVFGSLARELLLGMRVCGLALESVHMDPVLQRDSRGDARWHALFEEFEKIRRAMLAMLPSKSRIREVEASTSL